MVPNLRFIDLCDCGLLRRVKLCLTAPSFAPEVRMPFSQTSFGGSSVATFTPNITCQEVSKTTTTRNCGQGIALGLDTISKDGLTNVIVGTSFDQMGGQTSSSIELKVMKQW